MSSALVSFHFISNKGFRIKQRRTHQAPPMRVLLLEGPLLQVGHLHCRLWEAPREWFLLAAKAPEGDTDLAEL